jgi:hypothetical protein
MSPCQAMTVIANLYKHGVFCIGILIADCLRIDGMMRRNG